MLTDLTTAFRGSAAVAAGLITPGILRGPGYQRLFPDVHAPSALEPDLALRARAAGVLVAGRGVVAGHAAAELHGASSGPPDDPVDVLVPHSYRCAGLRVHRGRVPPDETTRVGGVEVTTPVRTAFDLARWAPGPTERVVAVDALGRHCAVDPDAVRTLRNRHLGMWRGGLVAEVLALTDARAESPMEQGSAAFPRPPSSTRSTPGVSATTSTSPTRMRSWRSSTTAPTTARSNGHAATCCGRPR